jgi:hypothetical protein
MRAEVDVTPAIHRRVVRVSAAALFVAWYMGASAQENAASAAAACDLPKLFAIPPVAAIVGNEEALHAEAKTYFTGIAAYSACIQAELVAAGGEQAPELIRQVLIRRNNAAVDEADFMMKRFTETFGPAVAPAAAASTAAPGPAPVASSVPPPAAR